MCHECSGVYVNSVVSDFDVSYPPKFAECEIRNTRVGLTLRAALPCCPLACMFVRVAALLTDALFSTEQPLFYDSGEN